MNFEFALSPSEKDVAAIYNGLLEFNQPHFPEINEQTFGLFVRDTNSTVVGGVTGKILFTSLHVNYLWLAKSIRGSGIGSELIKRIEQEAAGYGVNNIYLDTYTFQAPQFYERLGFTEVGRYRDFPLPGVDKIFYQKSVGRS
ncbi:GNAT family N-acetyltransferase [Psychromonas aquimarina]|uniref:GNAT family N-acetyltransferase n=1 Tax=Psychromonas aquimarina TaxID=444919 RepID=UPI000408452F|nr:GNAT family N-acetyltransferase [Psychromonas aquimarina]